MPSLGTREPDGRGYSQTRGVSGGGEKFHLLRGRWNRLLLVTDWKELGSQDAARISEEVAGCLPRRRQEKKPFDLEVGMSEDEEVSLGHIAWKSSNWGVLWAP